MRTLLKSFLCMTPVMVAVFTFSAHAQTTLPTPSTAGDGSVAAVPPPDGTSRLNPIANPTNPGATGAEIVPGDNSSMRNDRDATYDQRSGVQSR
jgi:hypothetical protein